MRNEKLVAFGQRVRELRKNKGLSQEAMAAQAGVDVVIWATSSAVRRTSP
jgi:transcriptional regulator with XRE-family HTH domain